MFKRPQEHYAEAEACSACVAVLPFLLDAEKSHGCDGGIGMGLKGKAGKGRC